MAAILPHLTRDGSDRRSDRPLPFSNRTGGLFVIKEGVKGKENIDVQRFGVLSRLGKILPANHLSLFHPFPPSIRRRTLKRDHSQDVRCNVQRFKFALCSVSNSSCNFLPYAADAKHDFNFICVPLCAHCTTFCPESNGVSFSCRLREISSLNSKKQYQCVGLCKTACLELFNLASSFFGYFCGGRGRRC